MAVKTAKRKVYTSRQIREEEAAKDAVARDVHEVIEAMEEDSDIAPIGVLDRDIIEAIRNGTMEFEEARYLFSMYLQVQRDRIRQQLRKKALMAQGKSYRLVEFYMHQFEILEKAVAAALKEWVSHQPVYNEWLKKIPGIGPIFGSAVVAYVRPEYCKTAGSIWRFAGIDVGPLDELASSKYNRNFKAIAHLIALSFEKNRKSPYNYIYQKRKEYERQRNERGELADQAAAMLKAYNFGRNTVAYKYYSKGMLPPNHIRSRALRYTAKIFLAHAAHVTYEMAYGEPPPAPYAIAHLGHTDFIPPPFFETKADYSDVIAKYRMRQLEQGKEPAEDINYIDLETAVLEAIEEDDSAD